LRYLAVHVLKIDQSFVRNLLTGAEAQAIVQNAIELSVAFRCAVIVEGAETDPDRVLDRARRVKYMMGVVHFSLCCTGVLQLCMVMDAKTVCSFHHHIGTADSKYLSAWVASMASRARHWR
jgi:sensor c-di-GMP phosphodiesterase-like protein